MTYDRWKTTNPADNELPSAEQPAPRRNPGRRPWTSADINSLKLASRNKTNILLLSAMLRRTEAAIRKKACFLKLPLGDSKYRSTK
jgi:hypothetical protein